MLQLYFFVFTILVTSTKYLTRSVEQCVHWTKVYFWFRNNWKILELNEEWIHWSRSLLYFIVHKTFYHVNDIAEECCHQPRCLNLNESLFQGKVRLKNRIHCDYVLWIWTWILSKIKATHLHNWLHAFWCLRVRKFQSRHRKEHLKRL